MNNIEEANKICYIVTNVTNGSIMSNQERRYPVYASLCIGNLINLWASQTLYIYKVLVSNKELLMADHVDDKINLIIIREYFVVKMVHVRHRNSYNDY